MLAQPSNMLDMSVAADVTNPLTSRVFSDAQPFRKPAKLFTFTVLISVVLESPLVLLLESCRSVRLAHPSNMLDMSVTPAVS